MRRSLGFLLLVAFAATALADIQDPPAADYGPTRKLGRGVSNIFFAADDGALFSVMVSNSGGTVTSNSAKLMVTVPPAITAQPVNMAVAVGQTAKFSVTATGTAPFRYQWRKNGVDISGATKASYITPATTLADNGSVFAVTVSNSAGSASSNGATLTVN